MELGEYGVKGAPSYALIVYGPGEPGAAMTSSPVEKHVQFAADELNEKARRRDNPLRFRVEKRVPMSLGIILSGTTWGNASYEELSRRRSNGC